MSGASVVALGHSAVELLPSALRIAWFAPRKLGYTTRRYDREAATSLWGTWA